MAAARAGSSTAEAAAEEANTESEKAAALEGLRTQLASERSGAAAAEEAARWSAAEAAASMNALEAKLVEAGEQAPRGHAHPACMQLGLKHRACNWAHRTAPFESRTAVQLNTFGLC